MRIVLNLDYSPPGLNRTKRMHWTRQVKEKKRAWCALWFALRSAATNYSTKTTQTQQLRICLMAARRLASFLVTPSRKSTFGRLPKNVLNLVRQKAPKSK